MRDYIMEHQEELWQVAQALFAEPEPAMAEHKSAQRVADLLRSNGFAVEMGIGGLPTAFVARWGEGRPVLAFLAEYDALPGMGQAVVPEKSPLPGCGQACGHHVLGVACAGAGMALKEALEKQGLPGTVLVYGCPAEEKLSGKVQMAEAGCFDGIDAAITWHPGDNNRVNEEVWLAKDTRIFRFYGKTAHAAEAPHLGRSALDAAELMNVGANYLREHVPDGVRLHYVYRHGGEVPNIVPDYAETEYYVRGGDQKTVVEVGERLDKVAAGAALMTETRVESESIARCAETKLNHTLNQVFYQAMTQTPLPDYTPEELAFAQKIWEDCGWADGTAPFGGLLPLGSYRGYFMASTDAANVSQLAPFVMIRAAIACKGTPLHHWAFAAQGGSTIGQKGMLYAAEAMARGAWRLATEPELLQAAWAEFEGKA